MIRLIKTVAITLLFIGGITLALENNDETVLRYFGWESPRMPVFLLVVFSVLLGVLFAGFGFLFDQWSLKRALREKEREIVALQAEIQSSLKRERPIDS